MDAQAEFGRQKEFSAENRPDPQNCYNGSAGEIALWQKHTRSDAPVVFRQQHNPAPEQ